MPTQQVESTLADLGISLIADRTPALMDHYLGFELITSNEEKTRAAGLLGFQVGQELLYVPVLFLNGKVKGTEVLYLKNSDVFTSNSKQWIEYLTTRNPGVMGAGANTPNLPQPSAQQLQIFSRTPAPGKLAGIPGQGLINQVAHAGMGLVNRMQTAHQVQNLIKNPPAATAPSIPHVAAPGAAAPMPAAPPVPGVPPAPMPLGPVMAKGAEIEISKEIHEGAADEFWDKVAIFPAEVLDLPKRAEFNITNVLRSLGKKAYLSFIDFATEKQPWLLEKMAHFYGEEALIISDWPEEKVASAPVSEKQLVFLTSEEVLNKAATLSIEDQERCFRDGFIVLDKRAADDKSVLFTEDYLTRFDAPKSTGFYEIVNRSGSLEKVFVALTPFLVEQPRAIFPSSVIVDLESGIFVLPIADNQVFVRSRFTPSESVWKEKMTGMVSLKSLKPNTSYMLISPELQVSAPFKVKNKSSSKGDIDYVVETPYELRYRAISPHRDEKCCSWGSEGSNMKIVDRDDTARIDHIGDTTFVPSSWKAIEVDGDSSSYQYASFSDDVKASKRKVYERILPGGSGTLTAAILNKGIFKLNLHKSGSYVTIKLLSETTDPMNKAAAVRCMVEEIGMDAKEAGDLYDTAVSETAVTRWIQPKLAFEITAPMAGAAVGALGGSLVGDPHKRMRNALLGAGVGAGVGYLGQQGVFDPTAQSYSPLNAQTPGIAGGAPIISELPDAGVDVSKLAANGLNAPGQIYNGAPFPDRQQEIGQHPSGFMETQPTTQVEQINMNSMADPSQDWRDNDQANWDKIQPQDLEFLQRAADSGSQPVFDSAMLGMLLRTNRGGAKVDEWLPDLVNGLDAKCRLLLTFYWHNQDFAEDYGKDEMAEFEDVLLNSIKEDGRVTLFLKQKAGESPNAQIDALGGE